jgi:hypothetical protein
MASVRSSLLHSRSKSQGSFDDEASLGQGRKKKNNHIQILMLSLKG